MFLKSINQKVAETQYGHTKIALEEDSDARKYLKASGMRKMGGASTSFSLDQSDENAFAVSVFGRRNFELNFEHLLLLSDANLSTDILPIFDRPYSLIRKLCTNGHSLFLC